MEVKYYNTSFKLDTLPLDAIHVIDDWLPKDMFIQFNFLKYICHEKNDKKKNLFA